MRSNLLEFAVKYLRYSPAISSAERPAKGFKEIKWLCISRIQYGKKKCHNSPTVDELALHKAIVRAINEFCVVKDNVAKVLSGSVCEVLDPNQNGSIQAAQQWIDKLARNIRGIFLKIMKSRPLHDAIIYAFSSICASDRLGWFGSCYIG